MVCPIQAKGHFYPSFLVEHLNLKRKTFQTKGLNPRLDQNAILGSWPRALLSTIRSLSRQMEVTGALWVTDSDCWYLIAVENVK